MAKKLPLIKRVEVLLDTTSSDTERNLVFEKLYEIGEYVTVSPDINSFYSDTPRLMGMDWNKQPRRERIERGRSLYDLLCESVSPIIPNLNERGVNRRRVKKDLQKALQKEYSTLVEFYSKFKEER